MNEPQLQGWLVRHADDIARRWGIELKTRSGRDEEPLDDLRGEFLHLMVQFLGPSVGPWRDQVEPLVHQTATLYGNVAALRALAAGDVVEEMQVLREVILRFLFRGVDLDRDGRRIGLREFLRLSRSVDQMVTHANVGHIDALFFNLLHGTGVTEAPGDQLLAEIREELADIREELERFQRPAPRTVVRTEL